MAKTTTGIRAAYRQPNMKAGQRCARGWPRAGPAAVAALVPGAAVAPVAADVPEPGTAAAAGKIHRLELAKFTTMAASDPAATPSTGQAATSATVASNSA